MKTLNFAALAVAASVALAPAMAFAEQPQYQGLDPTEFGMASTNQTNWHGTPTWQGAPHETAAIRPVAHVQGQPPVAADANAYTNLDQREFGAAADIAAREGIAQ